MTLFGCLHYQLGVFSSTKLFPFYSMQHITNERTMIFLVILRNSTFPRTKKPEISPSLRNSTQKLTKPLDFFTFSPQIASQFRFHQLFQKKNFTPKKRVAKTFVKRRVSLLFPANGSDDGKTAEYYGNRCCSGRVGERVASAAERWW